MLILGTIAEGLLLRDRLGEKINLDPSGMYPKGFHPVRINRSRDFKGKPPQYNRTQRPPRYNLIYSSVSRQYNTRNALDEPLSGGNRSAPEHWRLGRCNPFRTDIYYLGDLVREHFMEVNLLGLVCFIAYRAFQEYNGFEFMEGLVKSMTHEVPLVRLRIEEVVARFSLIRESLSAAKLRSPITSRGDPSIITAFRYTSQAICTVRYIVSQKSAIPVPITENWGCLGKGIYFIVGAETYDDSMVSAHPTSAQGASSRAADAHQSEVTGGLSNTLVVQYLQGY